MPRWTRDTTIFQAYLDAPDEVAFEFFGADGYKFKLGQRVFEAIKTTGADGVTSRLDGIILVENPPRLTFYQTPLATVRVRRADVGFKAPPEEPAIALLDVQDGHPWLVIGTDVGDPLCPSFRYTYWPRERPPEMSIEEKQAVLRAKMRKNGHAVPMDIPGAEKRAILDMFRDDPDLKRHRR